MVGREGVEVELEGGGNMGGGGNVGFGREGGERGIFRGVDVNVMEKKKRRMKFLVQPTRFLKIVPSLLPHAAFCTAQDSCFRFFWGGGALWIV